MKPDKYERFARFKERSREQFFRSFTHLSASRLSRCLAEARAKEKGK